LIENKLNNIKNAISKSVTIVAVSKTKPINDILQLYKSGHLDFGENKVQELLFKEEKLPKDIKWHMIGHLQRNKVKSIVPFINLIHSVDSLRLIKKIDEEAKLINNSVNILLQVKISREVSKYGFSFAELNSFLNSSYPGQYQNINIQGLMGMATFTNDKDMIENEFKKLNEIYNRFKSKYNFNTLSIGMSGDYRIAIENGSNMLRLGSVIFGSRV
tara:strand:+ start:6045 stop:6692 length:648 start_codon:yes stop_codon:yes gene_type:complete